MRNITLSRDDKYLLAACWLPKGILVVETKELKPLHWIPVKGKISALYALRSQDKALFTLRDQPKIGILDTKNFTIKYVSLPEPVEDFFITLDEKAIVGSLRKGKVLHVIQWQTGKVLFEGETPGMPHLFSAAFWYNKGHFYFATPHLGRPWITVWQMNPWKFVTKINTGGAGFFVRTHANTPYLWVDNGSDQIVLIEKRTLKLKKKVLIPGKKVLHTEFSGDGKIAYISIFDKKGALLLLDSSTAEILASLPASLPVGKYNFRNKERRYLLSSLGREVFMGKCWGCHHQTQKAFGPSFRWIIRHRKKSQIVAQMIDPAKVSKHLGYKRNGMPQIPLNRDEIRALLAFMEELK
ncbi:MAG: hypothetical protein D6785_05300 [Planctomycetota bacterium]|nr:MAG: hypothetical protein D6785_05300 [Planctomycetota bacterium]